MDQTMISFYHKRASKSLKENIVVQKKIPKNIKTFSVPLKNKISGIGKKGEEITKTISYKLKCIDSTRLMTSSLSTLVDNLAEGIHKTKCKHGHDNKICEECGIKGKRKFSKT